MEEANLRELKEPFKVRCYSSHDGGSVLVGHSFCVLFSDVGQNEGQPFKMASPQSRRLSVHFGSKPSFSTPSVLGQAGARPSSGLWTRPHGIESTYLYHLTLGPKDFSIPLARNFFLTASYRIFCTASSPGDGNEAAACLVPTALCSVSFLGIFFIPYLWAWIPRFVVQRKGINASNISIRIGLL